MPEDLRKQMNLAEAPFEYRRVAAYYDGDLDGRTIELTFCDMNNAVRYVLHLKVEKNVIHTKSDRLGLYVVGLREPGIKGFRQGYSSGNIDASIGVHDIETTDPWLVELIQKLHNESFEDVPVPLIDTVSVQHFKRDLRAGAGNLMTYLREWYRRSEALLGRIRERTQSRSGSTRSGHHT